MPGCRYSFFISFNIRFFLFMSIIFISLATYFRLLFSFSYMGEEGSCLLTRKKKLIEKYTFYVTLIVQHIVSLLNDVCSVTF